MNFFSSHLSIYRARKVYRYGYRIYRKKSKKISDQKKHEFEHLLENLDSSIKKKEHGNISQCALELNNFLKANFSKTFWDQAKELVFALVFAIVVAFAIRQMWFELYEVPTGSMRPTIKEMDRLVVSKTTFGLNLPFSDDLVLFKPEYVKRGSIIVFTVLNMDVSDSDALYFYLFPGKKRFIKRCMGKAGDTVYFYGGRVYGIDKDGNDITELSDEHYLKEIGIEKIDHIPFINFDGKVNLEPGSGRNPALILNQMNEPIGKFQMHEGELRGLFYNGNAWVKDNPSALLSPHSKPESYADLWGFRNFAMVRLLSPEQYRQLAQQTASSPDDLLYLEIHHTPNLNTPAPQIRRDEAGFVRPMITPYVTYLPLQKRHLEALRNGLYTARFIVKNGKAYRYHESGIAPQRSALDVPLPQVADGTYEIYYGKAYSVGFGGIVTELADNHPLYSNDPEMIQKLFNLGINFNTLFNPSTTYQAYMPQRFAYFREGDLFVMGTSIMKKEDPSLIAFLESEQEKEKKSSPNAPYIAFHDWGAPLKNGRFDKEFIQSFGLKIPENFYLALGDNYAMSADSREFGFVPAMNLRGAPSLILWPPGKRMGSLPQASYPWITLPNLIIWTLVTLIIIAWCIYVHYRNKKPFRKEGEN